MVEACECGYEHFGSKTSNKTTHTKLGALLLNQTACISLQHESSSVMGLKFVPLLVPVQAYLSIAQCEREITGDGPENNASDS
jgi:hypothetical protein